jgi:hypothetical protein
MDNEIVRKLTEEEKQKVNIVLDDFFAEYSPEDLSNPEYTTEYDILMKQKEYDFRLHLLKDNEPSQIDSLMEMCAGYLKDKENPEKFFGADFGLIIQYDMWLNQCSFWPTHNPELWAEWDKLKNKKVKRG